MPQNQGRRRGVRLISIGDEVVTGRVVNSNAAWLSERLTEAGWFVDEVVSIRDEPSRIRKAIERASQEVDLVITTGGLGPTEDDRTVAVVHEILGGEMVESSDQRAVIEQLFRTRGREPNERSLQQARVPERATVLENRQGTAPGLKFELNDSVVAILPGVPSEMRRMFSEYLLPELPEAGSWIEATWLLYGIPESDVAIKLEEPFAAIPDAALAYLPNRGPIRLRVSTTTGDRGVLDRAREVIESALGEWIVSDRANSLQEELMYRMTGTGKTLAVAESCTGGSLGELITSVPGSGDFFVGGIISYSNDVKEGLLGVPGEVIAANGAVSREVAEAMARGVVERCRSSFGIGITGVAGPSGGTPEKPVGTVWIGWATNDRAWARKFRFNGDRESVRAWSVNTALGEALLSFPKEWTSNNEQNNQ